MQKRARYIFILLFVGFSFWGILTFMKGLSSEVTDAFGIMNQRLEESNAKAQRELDSLVLDLSHTDYSDKVKDLVIISEDLTNYIETLKEELITTIDNPTDYSKMGGSSAGDSLFFDEKGHSIKGQEFVIRVKYYQKGVEELFKNDAPEIIENINSRFNVSPDIDDWLEYNFKGFPLVATLTKLTQMQADIKAVKKGILLGISEKTNH